MSNLCPLSLSPPLPPRSHHRHPKRTRSVTWLGLGTALQRKASSPTATTRATLASSPTRQTATGHAHRGDGKWRPQGGRRAFVPPRAEALKCPCRGEDHPNPTSGMRGRGAPQIDILNVQTPAKTGGEVSQTFRFAPMNAAYTYAANGTQVVNATEVAKVNDYQGRVMCVLFPFLFSWLHLFSCPPCDMRLIVALGCCREEAISALINVPAGAYASDGSNRDVWIRAFREP
jgi:hypothetical protein